MSKIIYSLKMALLIGVYQMSPEDERIVVIMAQFCAIIYAKYWFEACLPTKAAVNDLKMLKMLQTYEKREGSGCCYGKTSLVSHGKSGSSEFV